MRIEEARWISTYLKSIEPCSLSPMLDLGSSTKEFREVYKPHIHNYIFQYLEQENVNVIHFDQKNAPGVDVYGDVFDDEIIKILKEKKFRSILCANILEHVNEPGELVDTCMELLSKGGMLIITVPYSYPYHPDPIDTMFRPSPNEISKLVSGAKLLDHAIVNSNTLLQDIVQNPVIGLKLLLRLCLPFLSISKWKSAVHRLAWLFKPYKVSIAVLVKI
jgi:hypothetical protein